MKLADQPTQDPVQQDPPKTDPAPQVPPVAPAAPVQQPVEQVATPQIPEGASDRTKEQFDKLIESNKRLAEKLQEEIAAREKANQTFDPIQQVPQPQVQPTQIDPNDFITVNPVTGEREYDIEKMATVTKAANERASKAEQAVQSYIQTSEQREIERQNRETFEVYPELDPDSRDTFDVEFSKGTRAIIYDSLINPQDYGGRPLSFKEAADQVKTKMATQPASEAETKPEEATDEAKAKEAQALEAAKEQASLAAVGQQPESRETVEDEEAYAKLVEGTRAGDDLALAMRLKNTDHTGTPSSSEET